MLGEALSALAATAGTGLVTAMITDGWQEAKTRVARLLGRGDPQEQARQEDRLERARQEVATASEGDGERVRQQQAVAWRTRFEDLLEDEPEREADLRDLVASLAERGPAAAASTVRVNAQAFDQAQQAVQGQGTQHNTFTAPPVEP